jgi:hypothetical protein
MDVKFSADTTGSDITKYKHWKDKGNYIREAQSQRQYNVNEQAQVLAGRNVFEVLQTLHWLISEENKNVDRTETAQNCF